VAILTSTTQDILACLRGDVNGGAEKNKDLERPGMKFKSFTVSYPRH